MGCYWSMSTIAFIAEGRDKSAARTNRWRTAEGTLHLLALAGGWPGALAARHLFRHKSKKRSFIVTFWITVTLNLIGLFWLTTPGVERLVHSLLRAI